MKFPGFALLSVLLAFFFHSCSEDENLPQKGRLSVQAITNKQVTTVSGRVAAANDLVFTTGHIKFREVVFDADRTLDGLSISVTHEQVSSIDFATGIISPEVVIDVPVGYYENVYLGIEIQDEGATPAIAIEGEYTDSNEVTTPIRFEFNSGEVFEAVANGITLSTNQHVIAKIMFDPQYWFSPITSDQLDNAIRVNGKILITASSNTGIFTIVADRLDDATEIVFHP